MTKIAYSHGLRVGIVVCTLALVGAPSTADADLFWSGDGTTLGGVGTWNTTLQRWSNVNTGPFTTVWTNSPVENAILDGTPGAITTGSAITVGVITANTATGSATTSWLIGNSTTSAANPITFSGANAGINANFTGPSQTIFLRNAAIGTLTKTGAGRLEVDNTMMAISKYIINAGSISFPNVNRFGAAPGSVVPDYFTFNGGGLAAAVAGPSDFGVNRGVTILGGGAFFGGSAATNVMIVSGKVTGSAGGNLTVTGGGPFYSPIAAGATVVLSNTGNDWNGNAVVNLGTLRTGASNVIPNTAVVSMTGGTFDMATNNTNETVKSISGTGGTITLGAASTLTLDNPAGETATQTLNVPTGGKIVKNGTGAITLSGGAGNNNATTGFRGEFVLNDGTLGFGTGTMLGGSNTPTATLTINGGNLSNPNAGNVNMNAALITNLDGDFSADNSLLAAPGQIVFNGGTQTIRNSNRTITVNNVATTLAFTGVLAEDAAGRSLTKAGTGNLQLNNAANTYSGGTIIQDGRLSLDGDASAGTAASTITLAGGALNASASRTVATPNPINLTANSAITTTSAATNVNFEFSTNSIGGTGTLTFRNDGADGAGDTFKPTFSGTFATALPLEINDGATGQTELTSSNASGTQTFSGDISGTGGGFRRLTAGGTTEFTGNNTYSGNTVVEAGTLLVNNTAGSGTGTGTVTVLADGTLSGSGFIGGDVTINDGGELAPGTSPGTLTINNGKSLSLNPMSDLIYDITAGDQTPGGGINDLTDVAGDLVLGGVLSINGTGDFSVLTGSEKWVLIKYGGAIDTTNMLTVGPSVPALTGNLGWGINVDTTLKEVQLVLVTVVPEAGSFLAVGVVALLTGAFTSVRRRRTATVA